MTKVSDLPIVRYVAEPKTITRTPAPECVGIILDGNRRWAKERGLSTLEGHRAGAKALKAAVRFIAEHGAKHLIVYAFSTENWHRPIEEVSSLMDLFIETIQNEIGELAAENVRVRFAGERERFSPKLQKAMVGLEEKTVKNTGLNLWICVSYGGRAEIVAAARAAAEKGEITEESISRHLWTNGMPDPDLVIRTGGEKRLSNFLPWQSVYSEFFFVPQYWPDFSEIIFESVVSEFAERERRHGK